MSGLIRQNFAQAGIKSRFSDQISGANMVGMAIVGIRGENDLRTQPPDNFDDFFPGFGRVFDKIVGKL